MGPSPGVGTAAALAEDLVLVKQGSVRGRAQGFKCPRLSLNGTPSWRRWVEAPCNAGRDS